MGREGGGGGKRDEGERERGCEESGGRGSLHS